MWCLLLLLCVYALDNGLGLTPPLGWNSWNHFGCDNVSEVVIRHAAQAIVSTGLAEKGYKYVVIDDCWQGERGSDGKITADPIKFPSGIKALADYVHGLGLLFGIYSDAGSLTCQSRPGSRGYEELDAETYSEWEVDFLKYDNCFANASDFIVSRYMAMGSALQQTGRPIYYSTCDWGVYDPWLGWGKSLSNSWRTTDDIQDEWNNLLRVIDNSVGLAKYAGPGGWNDADMLEVGNGGMTQREYESHFALWCLMKSPLFLGSDLDRIDNATMAIITNEELIAINQDALGVAGDVVWKEGANEIWAGPISNGSRFAVLFNRHAKGTQYPFENITLQFSDLGYPSGTKALVRDLYGRVDLGVFTDTFLGVVDIHGCNALKITPLDPNPRYDSWRPWLRTAGYQEDSSDHLRQWLWAIIFFVALAGCACGILTAFGIHVRRNRGFQLVPLRPISSDS